MNARTLVEAVRVRACAQCCPLVVFWYAEPNDREALRRQVCDLCPEFPLFPFVIRDRDRFEVPNAILADIRDLLDENQELIRDDPRVDASDAPIALLLIGRAPLQLPQVASPMEFPQWFPRRIGREATVTVEDITHTASARLSAPEACLDDLRALLHECERQLVNVLERRRQANHTSGLAFYRQLVGDSPRGSWGEFLCAASAHLDKVHSPEGYRPSLRSRDSLAGRVLSLAVSRSTDQLDGVCRDLAAAMGLTAATVPSLTPSLSATLNRPTNTDQPGDRLFARNLLITLLTSCQFSTVAAHAGDYPAYPVVLLQATSADLRRSLRELTEALRDMAADCSRAVAVRESARD